MKKGHGLWFVLCFEDHITFVLLNSLFALLKLEKCTYLADISHRNDAAKQITDL